MSSNKLDLVREVEECLVFHRGPHLTSRSAATETTRLKVQQSEVKLIYCVMSTCNPKSSLYSSRMCFKGYHIHNVQFCLHKKLFFHYVPSKVFPDCSRYMVKEKSFWLQRRLSATSPARCPQVRSRKCVKKPHKQ